MALVRLPQGWTPSDLEGAVKEGDSIQTCKGTFKCRVRPRAVPLVAVADTETIHVDQAWYILQDTITVEPKRVHTMQIITQKNADSYQEHDGGFIPVNPLPGKITAVFQGERRRLGKTVPVGIDRLMKLTQKSESELIPYLDHLCHRTNAGYVLKLFKTK
jgi:hypothetical protein